MANRVIRILSATTCRRGGLRSQRFLTYHLATPSDRRRRSAFDTTDTELRLMASAAIIGDRSSPVTGYSTVI